jgi:methionine-rich copper-binding protein CopC
MKAWLVLGVAACTALGPFPALARPKLVKARPEKGVIVKKTPTKIQLWFHEDLDTRGSSFTVVNQKKERVDRGQGKVDLHDRTMMEGPVGPLPPGVYTVKWKAVADDDKGVTERTFTFRVRE